MTIEKLKAYLNERINDLEGAILYSGHPAIYNKLDVYREILHLIEEEQDMQVSAIDTISNYCYKGKSREECINLIWKELIAQTGCSALSSYGSDKESAIENFSYENPELVTQVFGL